MEYGLGFGHIVTKIPIYPIFYLFEGDYILRHPGVTKHFMYAKPLEVNRTEDAKIPIP